ncbi:MAG: Cof-type HAD-IIB family hydrolase [Roseburia sp.]
MSQQYEMIVLDLDGTLLTSEKKISPATREILIRLQEAGKRVVLASGRPTSGIMNLAHELKLDIFGNYVLAFNGGRIINCATGEIVYNRTIPKEFLAPVYETICGLGLRIVTYGDNEIILGNGRDRYCELEGRINNVPMIEVDDFLQYVDFPVNKCLAAGEPEEIAQAQNVMRERFGWELNIFRSEPFFLEIMPQSIDKAHSLGQLLEHLHMQREQMICCGDGFNDRSMIAFAGLGVAMDNAQPEVKEVADYVTASNDEDGIVQVVRRFMEGEEIQWKN